MRRGSLLVASAMAALLMTVAATPALGATTPAEAVHAAKAHAHAPVTVGVFLIESATIITQIEKGFEQGFLASTHLKRSQVHFDVKNAQGNETLIETIARQYAQSKDAMVAVIGTPAVVALAKLTHRMPIIAVAMGDPVGAGVAKSLSHPGKNVSGSIDYVDPSLLLPKLLQVKPRFSSLGTIYNPSDENSVVWVKALRKACAQHHVRLTTASITSSAQDATAAQSLQGRVQAILIGPDADAIAGLPAIAKAASTAHQALYIVGGSVSTPGVLASLGPNYPALGRQAGHVAGEVDLGKKVGTIPFSKPKGIQWAVNRHTMKALGLTFPASAHAG